MCASCAISRFHALNMSKFAVNIFAIYTFKSHHFSQYVELLVWTVQVTVLTGYTVAFRQPQRVFTTWKTFLLTRCELFND